MGTGRRNKQRAGEIGMVDPVHIGAAYKTYTESYGAKEWALSLESSLYLARQLEKLKPKAVIDFGSGFSSWLMVECADCPVYSVETDLYWKTVTKTFCESLCNNTEQWHIMSLEQIKGVKADLVLHDIKGEIRGETLDLAMGCLNDGGTFFADDCQRAEYVIKLLNAGNRHGIHNWDTLSECKDEYGRFPMVGIKRG